MGLKISLLIQGVYNALYLVTGSIAQLPRSLDQDKDIFRGWTMVLIPAMHCQCCFVSESWWFHVRLQFTNWFGWIWYNSLIQAAKFMQFGNQLFWHTAFDTGSPRSLWCMFDVPVTCNLEPRQGMRCPMIDGEQMVHFKHLEMFYNNL